MHLNPAEWPGGLAYIVIFLGPIIETEVVLIGAIVLVSLDKLNPWGVLVAGALGGSAGDQFWFYVLKDRLGWLARIPWVAKRHEAMIARVRRHQTIMPIAARFLPGLRVAISAACAYAGVSALRFTLLNLAAAFVWVAALMAAVLWGGPAFARSIGLEGWWAFVVPAVLFVLFFRWLAGETGMKEEAKE